MSQETTFDTHDDAASDVASTALSTSFTVATPTTLVLHQAQAPEETEDIPNDAERFMYHGRQYVLESALARSRSRTSWVWRHGMALVDVVFKVSFFKCIECTRPVILRAHATDHCAALVAILGTREYQIGSVSKRDGS